MARVVIDVCQVTAKRNEAWFHLVALVAGYRYVLGSFSVSFRQVIGVFSAAYRYVSGKFSLPFLFAFLDCLMAARWPLCLRALNINAL